MFSYWPLRRGIGCAASTEMLLGVLLDTVVSW